jgi:hypothetical protein
MNVVESDPADSRVRLGRFAKFGIALLLCVSSLIAFRSVSRIFYLHNLRLSDSQISKCISMNGIKFSGGQTFAICRSWSTDNGLEKHAIVYDTSDQIALAKGDRNKEWRIAVLRANAHGAYGAFADSGFDVTRISKNVYLVDFLWRQNSEI